MSKFTDEEIEQILGPKVNRAIMKLYQDLEERWIVILATILILAGILLFVYALERSKE